MRSSAAVHMHELTLELVSQGHEVTVIIPVDFNSKPVEIYHCNGYELVSVLTLKSKDVVYVRRAFAEFISPYVIYRRLKYSGFLFRNFDGIIWYSPSIFWGPLISRLKKRFSCPAYLVLRDMFPDWALDLGILKKGLPYYFLKLVELYQYKVATIIGIQAPGNFKFFEAGVRKKFRSKVELLWTWVTPAEIVRSCSINLSKSIITGRKIFVYAGNMGVAQNFDLIMNLAKLYKDNKEIGFLFVGRGSEVERLKRIAIATELNNIAFFDEIDTSEIPALYSQCWVGLVLLDLRHKSNNIPGKFLSYLDSGLPVMAIVNEGNDLIKLIDDNEIGSSYVGSDIAELQVIVEELRQKIDVDKDMSLRCKQLANNLFSTKVAVMQILNAFECKDIH